MNDYMREVPGGGAGPGYAFRMGRYEITVSQFVAFLNNAEAHPSGPHMVFQSGGDVGISGGQLDGMFDLSDNNNASFNNGITYSSAAVVGMRYGFNASRGNHPIVGVGWLGAVKFCNWLTIDQGLAVVERCYTEGSSMADWHPVTISGANWALRDLNAAERQDLVDNFPGFRLPMENVGFASATWLSNQENTYNEWYKAAAYDPAAPGTTRTDPGGASVSPDHWFYGFGRDTRTGTDANYLGSAHPFQFGTTPVGYYDGTNHGGAFGTNPNENPYAIFDLSGNVWEWGQDYADQVFVQHSLRSGSWVSAGVDDKLLASFRTSNLTEDTEINRGFRVVQVSQPPPPPPPTGGCCIGGNCQIATAAVCNALNGTYQGNGTTCAPPGPGNPNCGPCNGSCFMDNGTPGCDNATCCNSVCGIDQFCCNVSWDAICANLALQECGAIMTLAPSSTIAQPGGSIQLDVLLESVIDLRAYQVEIEITQLTGSGTVEVTCPGGVKVGTARPDYVFAGLPDVLGMDCLNLRLGSALVFTSDAVDVVGPAYLGDFTLDVSGNATPGSMFEIAILPEPDSFLRDANVPGQPIPFVIGSSFILPIADTVMTCELTSNTVAPGGSVDLELYLGNVNDLWAYQGTIEIRPLTGAGAVDVNCPGGVMVDTMHPDWVFAGLNAVAATDCPGKRLGAALLAGGTVVMGPRYLGHYTLDVAPSALEGSTYEIAILPDPDSFLRSSSSPPQAIPMGISMPCRLTIASCGPPTVTAAGPRYIEVVPPSGTSPVAIRVTWGSQTCSAMHLDLDTDPVLAALGIARLVAAPVYRTPTNWGVLYVSDEEVLPATSYTFETVCSAGTASAGASATTWNWADVNYSTVNNSGVTDFDDILCLLDTFAGNFSTCALFGVDLLGAFTDGKVDFDDVLAGLNAYAGVPYPFVNPCPTP